MCVCTQVSVCVCVHAHAYIHACVHETVQVQSSNLHHEYHIGQLQSVALKMSAVAQALTAQVMSISKCKACTVPVAC